MIRQKMVVASVLVVLAVGGGACGSEPAADDATTTAPSTGGEAETTTAAEAEGASIDGLRGVRYCEVLLVNSDEDGFSADVWNTLGLNDCPQDQWEALDADAIAAERNALMAVMNGPRYWVLDRIFAEQGAAERPQTTFGELDMLLAASVSLGAEPPSQDPYIERSVARETVFGFDAGSEIYELTAPDGIVYVMQAYSQIVDPDLSEADLAGLGSVIDPPEGWAFSVRVLEADLDVLSTDGVATVVQDELTNTYQRIDT